LRRCRRVPSARDSAEHVEQLRGVAVAVGLHRQRAAAVVVDARVDAGGCRRAEAAGAHHVEADAGEARVGFEALRCRPFLVETDGRVADVPVASNTPVLSRNGPVVEVARYHRAAACNVPSTSPVSSQCTALAGMLLRSQKPFAAGRRVSSISAADVDPRSRAIALPPQSAARIRCNGAVHALSVDAQRGGAHAPARAFAPATGLAAQLHLVHDTEAFRPVEAHFSLRIEIQGEAVAVAVDPAAEAVHTRRLADRIETEVADDRAGTQGTAAATGDFHVVQRHRPAWRPAASGAGRARSCR
jgi:hypothetical protein